MDSNEVFVNLFYLDGGLSNCNTMHLCVVLNILWEPDACFFT